MDLITRNTEEIIGLEEIEQIVKSSQLKVYWGTAPTGRIHIGYFIPLLKICDLVNAGCSVKILIADLHAILDSLKSDPSIIKFRNIYYIEMIKLLLEILGITDNNNIEFVLGSSYQLSKEYTMDVYRAHSFVTIKNALHAGTEVVKQTTNPTLNSLKYPTLQALDEQYLKVDVQLGGIDQRKIFMHSRSILPKLSYKKRSYIMTPMLGALSKVKIDPSKNKMSASDTNKIDFLDSNKQIKKKINSSYCVEGQIDGSMLFDLLDKIIFRILQIQNKPFVVTRPEKYGGIVKYESYNALCTDYCNKQLHPGDLKNSISTFLIKLFEPIGQKFNQMEYCELLKNAY